MGKIYSFVVGICLLSATAVFSQSRISTSENSTNKHRVSDYPEGFYYTYDDFVNKKVRPAIRIERRSMRGDEILAHDIVADQVFFYSITDSEKVTGIFAISYRGNLYIGQKYLTKYAKKGNKNETGHNPNSYHRIIKDGKYFYMEGVFANAWAQGLGYNLGASGAVYAASLDKLKPVLFDFGDNKFDFIKDCDDFNSFIYENNLQGMIDCDKYDILKVREVIDRIM